MNMNSRKTAESIKVAFGSDGSKEPCIIWRSDLPREGAKFFRGNGAV